MWLIGFQSWKVQIFLVQMILGFKLQIVINHRQRGKQGFWKHIKIYTGHIRNAQNQLISDNRQNYFGCKIQTTNRRDILLILCATPSEPSRKRNVIEYIKAKVNKLKEKSKNKIIREIHMRVLMNSKKVSTTRLCHRER